MKNSYHKNLVTLKFVPFLGARIEDLNHYIVPIIKTKPDYLILHVGTNDATTNSSRKIVDSLLMLRTNNSQTVESFYQNPPPDMIMERQM